MNCQDFREFIDSYLSDELLTETNHGILAHLESCADCRLEIEARREVRVRLRNAVLGAEEYRIDPAFEAGLKRTLAAHDTGSSQSPSFGLSFGSWAAVAAGLLVVFTLGFIFIGQSEPTRSEIATGTPYIEELEPSSIVNIALGDHEHCAIRHRLEEVPVSLSKARSKFRGLDKIVAPSLKDVLSEYKVVEAHACKYKSIQFAHVVLTAEGKTMSVLVTDRLAGGDRKAREGLMSYASTKPEYQISFFDTEKYSIFVVSNSERDKNEKAGEALIKPMKRHFASDRMIQTALLTIY